jgi:hypothetical protein
MPSRLTVGRLALTQAIGVRFPGGQPVRTKVLRRRTDKVSGTGFDHPKPGSNPASTENG